jgi:hypothetical protein
MARLRVNKVGAYNDDPSGWNRRDAASIGTMSPSMNNPRNKPIVGPSTVDLTTGTATPIERGSGQWPVGINDW